MEDAIKYVSTRWAAIIVHAWQASKFGMINEHATILMNVKTVTVAANKSAKTDPVHSTAVANPATS